MSISHNGTELLGILTEMIEKRKKLDTRFGPTSAKHGIGIIVCVNINCTMNCLELNSVGLIHGYIDK